MTRVRAGGVAALLGLFAAGVIAPGAAPAGSHQRSFRLIAMDMRQDLADTISYATYHAHLAERLEAASTAFATDGRPTMVFLPEDAGLMAWLVGPRAAHARALPNSSAAIAALAATYAPQVAYYAAKCPGIPPARALVLALTDTAWRAFGEGLARLAAEHGVFVMASHNVPTIEVVTDPARVALLADPAAAALGYAYEGGCHVYNNAMLFSPSSGYAGGAADPANVLAGFQRKAYLVPIERTQDVGLAMTGEPMAGMRPIDLGFGRLGVLTSKDAWMPDAPERLDDLGAEVFLQPEAGGWGGHGTGLPDWPPDAMHRAIWGQVQRLPGFRYGALSNLTGNFIDLYFDGTATITKDASPADPPGFLLGRLPGPGIVARAPWAFPDPPAGVSILDVAGRRVALDAAGATLYPGSGAPTENAQLEELVWTDVVLPAEPPPAARVTRAELPASVAVDAGAVGPQWAPSIATTGAGLAVAWTDLRHGDEGPAIAVGAPGAFAVALGGRPRRPDDQQGNEFDARVAVAGGEPRLVWTTFRNQSWSIEAGDAAAQPLAFVDDSPATPLASGENFGTENINHDPALAAAGGTLYAAWADVRGRRVPWRIAVARSGDGGATWSPNVRADGGGALERTFAEAATVVHEGATQFAPSIAVAPDGDVLVAWQDHTQPEPRIVVSRSTDGAATFGSPVVVDAAGGAQFRPALAVSPSGTVAVAWEQAAGTGAGREIRLALDPEGDGTFSQSTPIDPDRPAGAEAARARLAFGAGGSLTVVWQDDRAGDRDVLTRTRRPDGTLSAVVRVDDGTPGSDAIHPDVTPFGDGFAVVYDETERIRLVLV